MVLVIVALVRIVHVPRLIAVMLVSVTLVSIVLMLTCVVLVIVALVRVVHVPRLISMVLVTVTLVWIVDAHPVLLPTRGLSLSGPAHRHSDRSTAATLQPDLIVTLSVSNANHPHLHSEHADTDRGYPATKETMVPELTSITYSAPLS